MFRARGWRYIEGGAAVTMVAGLGATGVTVLQSAPAAVTAGGAAVTAAAFSLLTLVVAFDRLRIRGEANELRARLERALAEDPETGLSSISRFRKEVSVAIARFKRRRERFTLVVMRLPVERQAGGPDPSLRDLAREVAINLRQDDTLARVGDREIGALLAATGSDAAENFLLRIGPALRARYALAGVREWTNDLGTLDDLLRSAREDLGRRLASTGVRAAG